VAHNGRNVGTERVKLIVFYASTRGQRITMQARDDTRRDPKDVRAPGIKARPPPLPAAMP
jgi:hypothetical protein